eukprot:TRINITY_DN3036_c0_g4_i1.p2 TRINITY_DN3036_c0_g4~~TRINITY_DN3036_c0_g4_i1.p2  ORF type:complete len:151 (-),score=33.36 TRINITY_DN3036_c0_g4_i1:471-923(-)
MMGIGLPTSESAPPDIGDSFYWRFMLGFPLLVAVAQTILLFTIYKYETPKFLYIRRRRIQCDKALSKVYTTEKDIDRVLSKLKAVTAGGSGGSLEVGWKELFSENYITALFVIFGASSLISSHPLLPAARGRKCVHDVFGEDLRQCKGWA